MEVRYQLLRILRYVQQVHLTVGGLSELVSFYVARDSQVNWDPLERDSVFQIGKFPPVIGKLSRGGWRV